MAEQHRNEGEAFRLKVAWIRATKPDLSEAEVQGRLAAFRAPHRGVRAPG